MKKLLLVLLVGSLVFLSGAAYASVVSDLSGTVTSDNHYNIFIGTKNSFFTGNSVSQDPDPAANGLWDWQTPETWNVSLVPGKTNYIVIHAWDVGLSAGVLGSFTLNNNNFKFSNGTQNLVTNTTNWVVYTDHPRGTLGDIWSYGTNGVAPWSTISGIDQSANWIWTAGVIPDQEHRPYPGDFREDRYFVTKVTATPEPISSALFLLGGGAMMIFRKKKSV